jgi:hypothetical protein
VNFARVSFKSTIVWAFWVLIVSCFSMNACSVSSRFHLGGRIQGGAYSWEFWKLWCAWNGGCEVCALLLPFFQLKFRWFLQPGLYVCEYGF